ncbi:unnamed protein product [Paramecium octaurelia]|uniref:Uncharacterized protein n=1 Tax=Paramecium octaurelia TaxID=43137 RepID=A0A8S1W1F3_PAROT|nr:unnamed protein product [Paramecium octaurelia]
MRPAQNSLNAKQSGEFKALVKLLDAKDYKKGLRNTEKLLEQVPDNWEVVSLKAIFMYYNDEQQKGLELAKQAVFKNLGSDFCWHIYGLIYKAQKNYIEAVKCFLQAIKKGEENIQLERDTANLQIHTRDFEGNAQLRHKILTKKSNMIVNWIAFIFAQHLIGNYEIAFKAISSAEQLIQKDQQNPIKKVEMNEFKLYQIQLAIDAKDYQKAKQNISAFKNEITDMVAYYELQYDLYIKLGSIQEAVEAAKHLLVLQPQNWKYYQLLKKADPQFDLSIYENTLVQGQLLAEQSGDKFKTNFLKFIDPFFQKSLPSLFREIKHLYKQKEKLDVIKEAYESYLNAGPIQKLWALMLLSQHYYQVKQYAKSLELVEEAIAHTPTLHELYLIKAKALHKQEKFKEAYEAADRARQLDLADRYLNNKTIKYALRANMVYLSQELLRMFLRDGSNPYELQMIWFELGVGRTLLRLNYLGPALAQFYLIFKHYQEMYDDQLDFYQFSIRKYTLRSLLQMFDAMDTRYSAKYFIETAGLMIEGLNRLKLKQQDQGKVEQKKLTPKEKKQLQKQQQKQEEEKHLREQFSIEGHIYSIELQKKFDLSGEYLLSQLKTEQDIIKLQNQFAQVLIHTNYSNKEVNFQAFKQLVSFYIQQNRPLLSVKLLNKLRNNQTESNRIVNHKYQLMLIQYLNSYKGPQLQYVQEYQQDLNKFDAEFWKSVEIKTDLDKTIKSHCEHILQNKPFNVQQLESNDLEFLQEYPTAKTTNPFYTYDPNLEWQNNQISQFQSTQQMQQVSQQQQ